MNGHPSAYVLVHATCDHVCMVSPDRKGATRMLDALQAAGYFRWRVRVMDRDDAAEAYLMRGTVPCETCRVDPARVVMAAEAWGAES